MAAGRRRGGGSRGRRACRASAAAAAAAVAPGATAPTAATCRRRRCRGRAAAAAQVGFRSRSATLWSIVFVKVENGTCLLTACAHLVTLHHWGDEA